MMQNHVSQPLDDREFLGMRRQVMLAATTYKATVLDAIETFDVVALGLKDADRVAAMEPSRPMGATRARAWDSIRYMQAQFTGGTAIERLACFLPDATDFWSEFAHFDKAFDDSPAAGGRRVPHIDLHDTDYWHAIRLTSFAILLGHTALLPRIAALWDYENDEMDGLLERLVAPFVPGRAPPPDSCTRHLPYFKLLKVFAAEPAARPALMARYMDQWYTASRREPYYESHTKGREHSFLGYWSFEAAAVAYVLDIDDASFRDHEFYPKDMADFARSLPRPAAIGGPAEPASTPSDRLRCLAGQPCPRTGYWFTPAAAGSRRHFDAGHTMPDLASSDGASGWATVWQWDEQQ